MAEHDELVAEMTILEQMGTQERQKLAKKRRMQQLKKWAQREKEWITKERQLNKRLANILHEENNGLNLKQYTHYGSAQRSNTRKNSNNLTSNSKNISENKQHGTKTSSYNPSKDTKTSVGSINNTNNNNNIITSNNNINNTANNQQTRNDDLVICRKEPESLSPNGRVHFNVGVMLLEAAARNDFEEVKRLLSLGVSPDSINHDGLTALHQCCIDASEPMMILLLDFGANVDARDTEQWTPLHAACTCGHLNLVKILVEHGADLLAVNGDGNMPFDVCEDETTLDYIESQMVARGITQEMIDLARTSTEMQIISDLEKLVAANRNSSSSLKKAIDEPINEDGVTRLHVAAANGYISAIKFLLKHGANVNPCDNDLWRPLHGAACWGNDQHCVVVEMLVEAGADLYSKTANDETAFDLCDNVELLDKLNQLKDELESRKAATGPDDRLRRTQSRTNSRVHSVRRTSVRDKNQISRREAREEALLRVESSEKVTSTTNESAISSAESNSPGSNNSQSKLNHSDNIPQKEPQMTQETDLDALGDETNKKALDRPMNTQVSKSSVDMVDSGYIDSPNHKMTASNNGKLDDKMPLKVDMNGQTKRSQLGLNTQTNDETRLNSTTSDILHGSTNQRQNQNGLNGTRASSDVISDKLTKNLIDKQCANTGLDTSDNRASVTAPHSIDKPMQQQSSNGDIVNSICPRTDDSNNNKHKTSTSNNIGDRTNVVTSNCDVQPRKQQPHQIQQQQQHIIATQVVPMNYTLSNLKKHRSDLRMRASNQLPLSSHSVATMNHSSLVDRQIETTLNDGNNSLVTAQTTTNSTNSSTIINNDLMQPSYNPDGESTLRQTNNGLSNGRNQSQARIDGSARVESPSLIFRKFHGEPSEAIDGDLGRTSRHKCCILM